VISGAGRPSLLRSRPRPARRLVVLAAALSGVLGVLAGCSSSPGGSTGVPTSAAPQADFAARLQADDKALDQGQLSYVRPGTLTTGTPAELRVTVQDIGLHPGHLLTIRDASSITGQVIYPRDVPTGGIVGLQITTCGNLACQAQNDARQAIVGKGSVASWEWLLTPRNAGAALVVIRASTYDGNSSTVLREEIVDIRLTTKASPALRHHRQAQHRSHEITATKNFIDTAAGLITTIGGAVVVVAGGVTWVLARRQKKKKKKKKTTQKPA
jgi:hypothetical protein